MRAAGRGAQWPMAESHRLTTGDAAPAATPEPQRAELFGDYGPAVICASAVILSLAIATIDKLTGYELQLTLLHLVPITMVTWSLGRAWGLALSAAVMAGWIAMFRGAHGYASAFYFYWDALVLLATFAVVVVLLARLREAMQAHEVSIAMLERLDAAAYVVDLQRDAVVFGNRRFRKAFDGRPAGELARQPAREAHFHLADGTPAVLRILL